MDNLSPRFNWTRIEIRELFSLPLDALFAEALSVKHANWPNGKI